MKQRSLTLALLISVLLIFSTANAAFAIGWLTPEWYRLYYPSCTNPTPEPQEPEPAPEPEPAEPQREPSRPDYEGWYGWLTPSWYRWYYQDPSPAPQPEPSDPTPAPGPNDSVPGEPMQPGVQTSSLTLREQRLLDLINAERRQRGISPVVLDMKLTEAARMKSRDMVDNNYFAHESPTFGSLRDILDRVGVEYEMAGDILAKTRSVDRAVELFLGSPVHRMHLLHRSYTHVGVGVVQNGSGVMVSVFFISR